MVEVTPEVQPHSAGTKETFPRWLYMAIGIAFGLVVFSFGIIVGAGITTLAGVGDNPSGAIPIGLTDVSGEEDADIDMEVFWEVWNLVNERYYYEIPSDEERVYGAINGMLESLDDPYTVFSDPEVTAIMNEDNTGTFEGIGAYVEQAPQGGVYIIRVFEDGPAETAGIEAGDIIVAVDGVDVTGMFLNEAILLVRGPADSEVNLTIYREGEDNFLDITVIRGRIEIPTVEYEMLENNIGYVALYEFNGQATNRLRAALEDLLDQGAEAIIFDLRNNPGGFRSEAVDVADLFLEEGVIMIQRNVDGSVREFGGDSGDLAEEVQLVVLINEFSASASEIVAGSIRDYERGTLIGQTTFGKGSVQGLYDLSDGSLLRITIANYYSPDDLTINGVGVDPDIFVEIPEDLEPGEDPQLGRAIEFIISGE